MTTSSTHDTKRGEDVRARIIALTAHPDVWSELVATMRSQTPPPDGVTGLFLLQNIIGVWPVEGPVPDSVRGRLHEYATKAIREASLITTWTSVDEQAETAVHRWIDDVIDGPVGATIAAHVTDTRAETEWMLLAHKGLSLLTPGVPDVYQGTEWFEDSLVDPDNRRPIDWTASTDHPKVAVVRRALAARRDHAGAFVCAHGYRALSVTGIDAVASSRSPPPTTTPRASPWSSRPGPASTRRSTSAPAHGAIGTQARSSRAHCRSEQFR